VLTVFDARRFVGPAARMAEEAVANLRHALAVLKAAVVLVLVVRAKIARSRRVVDPYIRTKPSNDRSHDGEGTKKLRYRREARGRWMSRHRRLALRCHRVTSSP
jgi:hypothetical protein